MKRKHRGKIRARPLTRLISLLAFLGVLFSFCESRIRLLPESFAELSGKAFAEEKINAVIENKFSALANGNQLYFDQNDKASALTTDAIQYSTLKAQISRELNRALNGGHTAYIPIGNLLHSKLLNGYGFKIPVHLYFHGTANVQLKSEIATAGINQSHFRLIAVVNAELYSNSLSNAGKILVSGDYLLCETVLLGDIPMFTPKT